MIVFEVIDGPCDTIDINTDDLEFARKCATEALNRLAEEIDFQPIPEQWNIRLRVS